jgi:RimJ/RimL family protein N-acetyltransferase
MKAEGRKEVQTAGLPPQFIELETTRFVLRTLQPGDAGDDLASWMLDPIAAEMMNGELKTWEVERQRSFFTEALVRPDRRVVGMFPKASGRPIGMYILRLNQHNRTFIVSTLIGDAAWRGLSVNKECGDRINQLLFAEHDFHKAKAHVLTTNKAMIWLLSQSAWRREGRFTKHLRNATTGERTDVFAYGLLKSRWLEFRRRSNQDAVIASDGASS